MKKSIALMLAIVLALSLAACGGGSLPGVEKSAQVGDKVTLGNIDWYVLAVESGKALLLSEKVLETRAYHSSNIEITWEDCDLRAYLNGSFYDNNFSDQEKKKIIETDLLNEDTSGNIGTKDKVFLLSKDEVAYYMGDTAHVNMKNAKQAVDLNLKASWWWLRSPVYYFSNYDYYYAAYVYSDGVFNYDYGVYNDSGGVRPALWLNL